VDWRADVYSLGCIMYEMAAGRPPFPSKSIDEARAHHLNEAPRSIRAPEADVPAGIDAFTLRLLAKEPARRIASTGELEQELAALGADLPELASDVSPVADTATPDHDGALHTAVTTLSSAAATSAGIRSSH